MRLKNGEVLLAWPLTIHIITAGWVYNSGIAHKALDFRANIGTPVYAAESGIVSLVSTWNGKVTTGDTNSYGNVVKVKHANYKNRVLETLYAHLSQISVKKGQVVEEGDLIGFSGNTGNCLGAHLHFEVRWGGTRVNPLNWLDADFICSTSEVQSHLGTFKSVPRELSTLQKMHIEAASVGDVKALKELADSLGLHYTFEAV